VELVPARLGVVAALTPGEVVGEIFDMDSPGARKSSAPTLAHRSVA